MNGRRSYEPDELPEDRSEDLRLPAGLGMYTIDQLVAEIRSRSVAGYITVCRTHPTEKNVKGDPLEYRSSEYWGLLSNAVGLAELGRMELLELAKVSILEDNGSER